MVIRRAWLDFRIIYLPKRGYRLQNSPYFCVFKYTWAVKQTSSETQGQIVGARESLNGRKNKVRRKEKNGEKSSSGRSLLFFCAIFFHLFRLSLAPTICPWVSEDVCLTAHVYLNTQKYGLFCSLERIKLAFILSWVYGLYFINGF